MINCDVQDEINFFHHKMLLVMVFIRATGIKPGHITIYFCSQSPEKLIHYKDSNIRIITFMKKCSLQIPSIIIFFDNKI